MKKSIAMSETGGPFGLPSTFASNTNFHSVLDSKSRTPAAQTSPTGQQIRVNHWAN